MANHNLPLLTCNSGLLTADSNLQLTITNFSHWSLQYILDPGHTENTTFDVPVLLRVDLLLRKHVFRAIA
jgi:hypothetical protein